MKRSIVKTILISCLAFANLANVQASIHWPHRKSKPTRLDCSVVLLPHYIRILKGSAPIPKDDERGETQELNMSDGTFGYNVKMIGGYAHVSLFTKNDDYMNIDFDVIGIRTSHDVFPWSAFYLRLKTPIAVKVPNRFAPSGYIDGEATGAELACTRVIESKE